MLQFLENPASTCLLISREYKQFEKYQHKAGEFISSFVLWKCLCFLSVSKNVSVYSQESPILSWIVSYYKRCNDIQLVTLFWLCECYPGMPHAFLCVCFQCKRCILLDLVVYKISQEGPIPSWRLVIVCKRCKRCKLNPDYL